MLDISLIDASFESEEDEGDLYHEIIMQNFGNSNDELSTPTLENERHENIGENNLPLTVCSNRNIEVARENSINLANKHESNNVLNGQVESPNTSDDDQFCHEPSIVTLTMPTCESMRHVLRCAFNAISGLDVKGQTDINIKRQYLEYFQNILESTSSELKS